MKLTPCFAIFVAVSIKAELPIKDDIVILDKAWEDNETGDNGIDGTEFDKAENEEDEPNSELIDDPDDIEKLEEFLATKDPYFKSSNICKACKLCTACKFMGRCRRGLLKKVCSLCAICPAHKKRIRLRRLLLLQGISGWFCGRRRRRRRWG